MAEMLQSGNEQPADAVQRVRAMAKVPRAPAKTNIGQPPFPQRLRVSYPAVPCRTSSSSVHRA